MTVIGRSLNHIWRWIGTAFSFLVFGIGGVLLPVIVVPVLNLLYRDVNKRQSAAKRFIHHSFRFYIGMMRFLGVLTYQIDDVEKFRGAQLVLANHPSLIDVIFLIALLPNANCVVKGRLVQNPFTRGPIRTAGYIINDGSEDVLAMAKDAFVRGEALIVFPEGTRTEPDQAPLFKRGAAQIAVRTEADISPVLIECSPTTLTKSDRWYEVPDKKVHVRIQVQDMILAEQYMAPVSPAKLARVLTRDLNEYFNKELKVYE
ncbi:lysophospholipid acyltransferase family protein [Aliamphritea ceti]|uniref:lysophospholipid acyltransferase family protein n=1 Tax=Aliamphritea ceti TaxID=1524258 RepID=UPI0021C255A9|nr:lysophospholipid acyltransferase family protein [Aliamphritea ceti]